MTAGPAVPEEVLRPDARLRAPARALPRGTIDCHAHIFDRFERYPLAPGRKYQPPLCAREAWLALHAALGVEYGVQVHGSPYGFDNSITEDFLLDFPGRFVGVAAISPDIPEKQLQKLSASGFRAARLMDQFATGATTKDLEAIAKRVAPLGWHIEINLAKSSDLAAFESRFARSPVPLVFDHLGRVRGGEGENSPGFRALLRLLTQRDDCWTKISSWYRLSDSGPPDFADMKPLVGRLLAERPDRCVWGTNWPHPGLSANMPNDADLVDQLQEWVPGNLGTGLFALNAAKLYRFRKEATA